MEMQHAVKLAINNVANYGDTDIFPFPSENLLFKDKPDELATILLEIHGAFNLWQSRIPPTYDKTLSAAGYTGFRLGTQIDPLWNAFLLATVLSIGKDIENHRIPIERNVVFSYRFAPKQTTGQLFSSEIGWNAFQEASADLANRHRFVLKCDISDFYPRIYHHRLINSLARTTQNTTAIHRISVLLKIISERASYGLPIGGPASRMLSELLLNSTDRFLLSHSINFCRFVDDFHIFADTREEAHAYLTALSDFLAINEGLSLQKSKTRIMTGTEFLESSPTNISKTKESSPETQAAQLFRLRLHYDPYSETAAEDYDKLRKEISQFDIVGMLAQELNKSRIDEALTKRLVRAIAYLDESVRDQAIRSLLESLDSLYPVFPTIILVINSLSNDFNTTVKELIFDKVRQLVKARSYIVQVPTNMAFAVRLLARDPSEETERLLTAAYDLPLNIMIKRDIILAMSKRKADYWISHQLKHYETSTSWERRALLVASYALGDEGRHWRVEMMERLDPYAKLIGEWCEERIARREDFVCL